MADPVELELLNAVRHLGEDRQREMLATYQRQRKDRGTAIFLQVWSVFCLPGVGRMYLGDVGTGIIQFVLSYLTCGVVWLWPLVDIFLIGAAADRHNRGVVERLMARQ